MKKRFVITSLIAAGLYPAHTIALAAGRVDDASDGTSLFDLFQKRGQMLSAHRSHSSHSSHRSSSGGGYAVPRRAYPSPSPSPSPAPLLTPPSRNYDSTPPSSILPSSPSVAPKPAIDPSAAAAKFKDTVKVVQLALHAYGYFTGSIDGNFTPELRVAISKMQADFGLKITGTVTPEVLNALKISGN